MRAHGKGTLIAVLFGVVGLVLCGGCVPDFSSDYDYGGGGGGSGGGGGGGGGSGGGGGYLAVSQLSSTWTGTSEVAGARDVAFLGLNLFNCSATTHQVGSIRLQGEGDLPEVEGVSLFVNSQRVWTGQFSGQEVVADNLSISIVAWASIDVVFAIDITAGAADGTSMRGSSRDGDLQLVTSFTQKWRPANLVSGWRTVGAPAPPPPPPPPPIGMSGLVVVGGDDLARLDPTGLTLPMIGSGVWQADGGIAVDPEGRWVVVASGSSPELVLVDMVTMAETARTSIREIAHSIIPGPMGDRVYVSLDGASGPGGVVEVIVFENLSAAMVGRTFLYGVAEAGLLTISANGDRLYLAESSGGVRVVDIVSGTELRPSLSAPPAVAIDIIPDGSRLLIVAASGDVHSIPVDGSSPLDGSTDALVRTRGFDVAVSIDGTEAYVLDVGVVHVIDPVDLSPIEDRTFPGTGKAVAAGSMAGEAIVLDDGGCLFVLEAGVPAREAVAPSGIQVWSMGVAE